MVANCVLTEVKNSHHFCIWMKVFPYYHDRGDTSVVLPLLPNVIFLAQVVNRILSVEDNSMRINE